MNNRDLSFKQALTAVRKTTLIMAIFAAVFLLAAISVHASDTVLTVQRDGETVKEFSLEDLQQIAADEGNRTFSFSAWNTFPTFKEYIGAKGPTVEGILEASGIAAESIRDTWTVSFMDKEKGGYVRSLTGKQFFEDRYYYPKGELINPVNGVLKDEAYSDAVKVPVIVSLSDVYDSNGDIVNNGKFKLYVGQVAPNEQNNTLFVDNLAAGGFIKLSTDDAPKCEPVTADPENLTVWREGKEITLTSKNSYEYDKIYFTADGTDPDYGSLIYNCGPKQGVELKPVISGDSRFVLQTVVKGYGKQDSDIQRFTYTIGEPLTVKLDGEILKTYDRDELAAFAKADIGKEGLDYSGYNTFPNLLNVHIDDGYRVDSIIKDATGKDVLEFDTNSTVTFTGSDSVSTTLTIGQLFGTERFTYPNAEKGTDTKGGMALPDAYKDRKSVPVVIESNRDSSLMFGQIAPNEQNHSEFVKYLLQGGVIEISNTPADKCEPSSDPDPSAESTVRKGEQIKFSIPEVYKDRRNKLYYIIDPKEGELPGAGCAFYYYGAFFWPEEKVNPPVFSSAGHHILATRVTAYGRQDSDVREFDYYVMPEAPTGLKGTVSSYNSVKLTWNAEAGASGYRIYRAVSGGTLTGYKDVGPDQRIFTDEGLVSGIAYEYAVSAIAEGKNKTLESGKSYSVKVTPVPGKTSLKLTAGRRLIKVKWSKVSGASGYVVMRSTKKNSGFKTVKTIKKGSTTLFTNKKLKKGKRYYYKVRAYRLVSGKKVYGGFSPVKSVKAK